MMRPSKKKPPNPKEVSLDPSIKMETPIIELPNNENKLFDEEDDVGTSTILDLSLPDMIYIKTQVFRLLRCYSPAPRKIARSDWATRNITHNMTSSIKQPDGVHSH